MSQYPPPTEYAPLPIYEATLDQPPHSHANQPGLQPQPPYSAQNLYPKIESSLSEVLQAQAHQATHALGDQRSHQQDQQPQPQLIPGHQHQAPHNQSRNSRLRKACDSCSIRKVKCDENAPCRACRQLDIPCTFDRPSRRRGPVNRHAESIKKKRRLDGDGTEGSTPASPTNAAHALAQLSSHPGTQLSAESICAVPTMNALIDDFFTHIHPLCPFPHEPSFREAWERREDYSNPPFLALMASMIACLVASFPRKPRIHLKSQTKDQYPSHLALVDKCREVCAQARGPGYLDNATLNVYDACTSYFLGLAGAYTFQWRQLRLYFGECLTILRSLGLHKAQDQGYTFLGGVPGLLGSNGPNYDGSKDLKLDRITEQIGRRLFWTLFVGVRTMQQLGASFGELTIAPPTPTEPLPPLPAEVDDVYIYPGEIHPQPPHIVPLVAGFNTNVRIYQSYFPLSTIEMMFGTDELFDWDRQQRILEQCLQRCKKVLDSVPDVLKVHSQDSQSGRFGQRRQPYYPPMPEYLSVRDPALEAFQSGLDSADSRRAAQYEIQKANIYATHLSIRSYLVEKFFTLLGKYNQAKTEGSQQDPSKDDSAESLALAAAMDKLVQPSGEQPDADRLETEMATEKEQVVKELLVVLSSIDMVNMEPNGDSFTQKIRQIASTLLHTQQSDKARKSSSPSLTTAQNQEYLRKFLDILNRLERIAPRETPINDPLSGGGAIGEANMNPVNGNGNGNSHATAAGGDGATVPGNNSMEDEESELRAWADLRDWQVRFQEQGGIWGFT